MENLGESKRERTKEPKKDIASVNLALATLWCQQYRPTKTQHAHLTSGEKMPPENEREEREEADFVDSGIAVSSDQFGLTCHVTILSALSVIWQKQKKKKISHNLHFKVCPFIF